MSKAINDGLTPELEQTPGGQPPPAGPCRSPSRPGPAVRAAGGPSRARPRARPPGQAATDGPVTGGQHTSMTRDNVRASKWHAAYIGLGHRQIGSGTLRTGPARCARVRCNLSEKGLFRSERWSSMTHATEHVIALVPFKTKRSKNHVRRKVPPSTNGLQRHSQA